MPKHTSEAIRRRVAALLDGDRRRAQAQLMADCLNSDSDRHNLGLTFRPDAAGWLHCYEHWHFAFEYAPRRKNNLAGRLAGWLMGACGGPNLPGPALTTKSLSAAQNSRIRADLRTLEKNMTPRQRQEMRRNDEIVREIAEEFAHWRRPENS